MPSSIRSRRRSRRGRQQQQQQMDDAGAARGPASASNGQRRHLSVTPDFPKKTKCISYVCQDQVYTHMIDVMSEISINNNKNEQELNHYIISLLHSDVRLEGLYNDQTITMKT
jgi:hypothetical protein